VSRKKKKKIKDPHAKREAKKYEKPVPSREYLLSFLKKRGKPASFREIIRRLEIDDAEEKEGVRRRLIAMERDGQLIRNRKNGYLIAQDLGFVRGYVIGHKDGFGFVSPDDGGDDLFIPAREMRTVFDGDKVLARIAMVDHRGRREAQIVEVLEHNTQQVVGRMTKQEGATLLIPDNPKIAHNILIPPENIGKALPGQIVVAELVGRPSKRGIPIGKIVEILGAHNAPGMEVDIAIRTYDIPHQWPADVEAQVNTIKSTVATKDKKDRLDLRELDLVTIDGDDAKDFDDAVFCAKRRGGWKLYAAIADVAHYVKPGTPLDTEAEKRGNSVYFPAQVVPMLPEILSNGLCSLNPKVDRLCMVCVINLDTAGKVTSYRFHEGVMRSKARLTYQVVSKILEEDDETLKKKYKKLIPALENLHHIFKLLQKSRKKRGAIELEIPETKIIYNNARKIARIEARHRNDAHRIIEECMLLANVCTADFLLRKKIPILYRNHLGPDEEKLTKLRGFLGELGLILKGGDDPTPKQYATLLKKILDRPDAMMIQTVMLRSLSQAVYHADNEGHFGLAYSSYTHFTSPIRRYPDLLVHRAIKHLIHKKKVKDFQYDYEQIQKLGAHCSMTERRADDATRSATDWLKCEFMSDKLGQIFDGVITGVTNFGVFVALNDIFVEGLVHITSLKNDFYEFDADRHRLIGQRTKTIYRLGDPITVQVAKVDLDDRKIDFELVIFPK